MCKNRRSRGTRWHDGLDADSWYHRSGKTPEPELHTSKSDVIGKIYGPRGNTVHVVRKPRIKFGFTKD